MSGEQAQQCNISNFRNPFIKGDDANTPWALSNTVLSGKNSSGNLRQKYLPYMMTQYRNAFEEINTKNSIVSLLLYASNEYKQFHNIFLNEGANPSLRSINSRMVELFESKSNTKLLESKKGNGNGKSEEERLLEELTVAENTYFTKEGEYQATIEKILSFLSKEYINDFEAYYDFEINILRSQLSGLTKYKALVDRNVKILFNSSGTIKSSGNIESDIVTKKKFATLLMNEYTELMRILPNEIISKLPKNLDEIEKIGIQNNSGVAVLQDDNILQRETNRIEDELNRFTKCKEDLLQQVKSQYLELLKEIQALIQSEKSESKAFQTIQEERKKVEEQRRKNGSQNNTKLISAYEYYKKLAENRVTLYGTFGNLEKNVIGQFKTAMKAEREATEASKARKRAEASKAREAAAAAPAPAAATGAAAPAPAAATGAGAGAVRKKEKQNGGAKNNSTNLLYPSNFSIKSLFEAIVTKMRKSIGNENTQLPKRFYYLNPLSDSKADENEIESLRVDHRRNLSSFHATVEQNLLNELRFLEALFERYQNIQKKESSELAILTQNKATANSGKNEAKLASLRADKTRVEGEITTLETELKPLESDYKRIQSKYKIQSDDDMRTFALKSFSLSGQKSISTSDELFKYFTTITDITTSGLSERVEIKNYPGLQDFISDLLRMRDMIPVKDDKEKKETAKKLRLKEISDEIDRMTAAPEALAKLVRAKQSFVTRIESYITSLDEILKKKKSHNETLTDFTKQLAPYSNDIFSALIQREKLRKKLDAKIHISNNFYELFKEDPLYKIMEAIKKLESFNDSKDAKNDKKMAIVRSITKYLNRRFEKLPTTMRGGANGNAISSGNGNKTIVPNTTTTVKPNTSKPNTSTLATNATTGKVNTPALVSNATAVKENTPALVSNASMAKPNTTAVKVNAPLVKVNVPKNISSTFFMERVYEELGKQPQDGETSAFLENVKKYEERLLKLAQQHFELALKSGAKGSNKLGTSAPPVSAASAAANAGARAAPTESTNKLQDMIQKMIKDKLINEIQDKFKEFKQENISSKKLMHLYLLQKYLFMEVILLYFILYLR